MLVKPDFWDILQPSKLKKVTLCDVFLLISRVCEKGSTRVKSRDLPPQKAHLGPLLNVRTQFQLPNSNLKVIYARNKLKK